MVAAAEHGGIEIPPFIEPLGRSFALVLVERVAGGANADERFAGGDVRSEEVELRLGQVAAADGKQDGVPV